MQSWKIYFLLSASLKLIFQSTLQHLLFSAFKDMRMFTPAGTSRTHCLALLFVYSVPEHFPSSRYPAVIHFFSQPCNFQNQISSPGPFSPEIMAIILCYLSSSVISVCHILEHFLVVLSFQLSGYLPQTMMTKMVHYSNFTFQ